MNNPVIAFGEASKNGGDRKRESLECFVVIQPGVASLASDDPNRST